MLPTFVAGGVLAAVVLTGCKEARSYAVRWRVGEREGIDSEPTARPQDDEISNSVACSRVGVSLVQVLVLDELGQEADSFLRPCFPDRFRSSGSAVQGNTIPPGEYSVFLFGERANELPWGQCPTDSETGDPLRPCQGVDDFFIDLGDNLFATRENTCIDGECTLGHESCDCMFFEVEEDETTRMLDFVLAPPPECEDGIDGDEDGLVDQLDPGCQVSDSESTPVLVSELLIDLSLFSGNPNAQCSGSGVGIARIQIQIDDVEVDSYACRLGPTRITAPITTGLHTLSVTALGAQGEPRTGSQSFQFDVGDTGAATPREFAVDFSDVDFLEPVEAAAQFTINLALPVDPENPDEDPELTQCTSPQVDVADYRIRLLDAAGDLVPGVMSNDQQVTFDGTPASCETSGTPFGGAVITEPLLWGVYQLEVEAVSPNGEVCWSNEGSPTILAPGSRVPIDLNLVDGAPDDCVQ